MKYRTAIIKAVENLKDASGSQIRTYIQEAIFPENTEWINSLFLRTLKSMAGKCGDLVEHNRMYRLSPQLERKVAEAIEAGSSKKNDSAVAAAAVVKEDKRKKIPAKKTVKAKSKIGPRRTMKKKEGERMEIRHEIPEPAVASARKQQKPTKVEDDKNKKKRSNSVVFSPKIKAEKAAMKLEKISL